MEPGKLSHSNPGFRTPLSDVVNPGLGLSEYALKFMWAWATCTQNLL